MTNSISLPQGLTEKNTDELKNILIESLKLKNKYSIFIFGSRSKNTYKKYSDIDLWIESTPQITLREISDLHEKIEHSDLPFQVDIVSETNCLPAYFENIQNEKKLWFYSSTPS